MNELADAQAKWSKLSTEDLWLAKDLMFETDRWSTHIEICRVLYARLGYGKDHDDETRLAELMESRGFAPEEYAE